MYINPNIYEEMEDCIKLTLVYKNTTFDTYFDKKYYEEVCLYHWRTSMKKNKIYVCSGQSKNNNKTIYLQNIILNFTPNKIQEVDHIDGDSLNNKCNNLRLIDRIDNIHNVKVRKDNATTGIRGISFDKRFDKFVVDFYFNKKRYHFKTFKKLEEAVYIRMLCEEVFLKEFRNNNNDEYKNNIIAKLSEQEKDKLKKYFIFKTGEEV